VVIRFGIKKLLLWILIFGAVYFISLSLFTIKATMLYRDLRVSYEYFQERGFDPTLRDQVSRLVPRVDSLISDIEGPLISPILGIVQQEREVNALIQGYQYLRPAIPVMGDLIGLEQRKRYLVAFQNSAEARGTGGIIGAFAVISLDKSRFTVERVGTNAILQSLDEIPIQMPEEYLKIYRSDPAIWQNSNLSPHFPYGARIWLALWQRQFNENLDGVITLDPIVLSSLLEITGPISVRGGEISSQNVVAETLSDSYLRYESDNLGRKQYLVEIIEQVAQALQTRKISISRGIFELIDPLLEHRILVYSTNKEIQSQLVDSDLSGAMHNLPSNEFRLVIINTAGNKMDYYIDRELNLSTKVCQTKRVTEAKFNITNTARIDSYLPAYVKGRLDLDAPEGKENSTALTVFLFGPPKAKVLSAMDIQDGRPAGFVKTELSRQAVVIPIELKAGERRSFVADFQGGVGPVTTHIQPLVRPQKTIITDGCSR
jgi:uncharacterized protein Usg